MKPVYRVMLISVLCLLLTLFSLGVGEISLSPAETCHYLYLTLTSPEGSGMVEQDVLQFIRLPHLVLSFFIGAGLAVCGAVMQAVMKNPLADPYLLGISSGASLGAVLAIALGIGMIGSFDGIGAAAFLGAGLVSLLILLISSISGKGEGLTLLLAGFALNAACSAAVSFFVTVVADTSKTRSIQFWMMGNIRADSWMAIGILAILVTAGCFYFFSQRRILDLMLMGDDLSLTMGQKLGTYRKVYIAVMALLVGAVVYMSGMIGFVGLIIPHGVRLLVGSSHGRLLPLAALTGGTFLCWADILGRNAISGLELPVGVMAALAGSPFFLWMLISGKQVRR